MKVLATLFVALLLCLMLVIEGCTTAYTLGSRASPLISAGTRSRATAAPDLPVIYWICDINSGECETHARFQTFAACERLLILDSLSREDKRLPADSQAAMDNNTQARCEATGPG